MTPPTPSPVLRVSNLDALRAVAVALVMGHHWWQYAVRDREGLVFQFFESEGWAGVDLFFVLSGFLVSGLVFREYLRYGSFKLGRFLVRRGFRIYPAFYLFLACSIPYWAFTNVSPGYERGLAAEALFAQNYVLGVWNHTWSLAIEEHFYLLLGVGLYLAARRGVLRVRPLVAVGLYVIVAVASGLSRFASYLNADYSWADIYTPSHQRMDALFLGVLLSYLLHFRRDEVVSWLHRWRVAVVCVSLPLCLLPLVLPQDEMAMCTWGLFAMSVGFGGITLCCAVADTPRLGRMQWLYTGVCRTGEYSYPIYLWHMMALESALMATDSWNLEIGWTLAGYTIGTGVAAVVATTLVDRPALRARDRWFPSRSGTLTAVAQ